MTAGGVREEGRKGRTDVRCTGNDAHGVCTVGRSGQCRGMTDLIYEDLIIETNEITLHIGDPITEEEIGEILQELEEEN